MTKRVGRLISTTPDGRFIADIGKVVLSGKKIMSEIQNVPVTYGGRVIGKASIDDDGTVNVKVSDNQFAGEFFALFENSMAPSFSIEPHIVPAEPKIEGHNSDTLNKVYGALATDCGLSYHKTVEAINAMQNAGILFRERL